MMLSFTTPAGLSGLVGQGENQQQQQRRTNNNNNDVRMVMLKASHIPIPSPTRIKRNEHEKLLKQQEQQQQESGGAVTTTTTTTTTPSRLKQQQKQQLLLQQKKSSPGTPTTDDEQTDGGGVVVVVDLTDLLRFMERKEWMCVVRFFEQHPKAPTQKTMTGNLPLHEALKHNPPLPVVNLLLELNPTAAKHVGAHGYLPLHVACLCRHMKADVIGRLIAMHPTALRTREPQKDGLPLHLAVQTGTSEEVLMELLTNYPEASFVQDGAGKIPLDYANESCHHHNRSIVALETAPILLAAAQAAQARTVRECDIKLEGIKDAHREYTKQLEERFQNERATFVRKEIGFADNLTYEKERNISLAEIVLDLKNSEKKLQKERDALQARLDEEMTEVRSLMEIQDREFRTVLERTVVTRDGGGTGRVVRGDNNHVADGTRRRSRSAPPPPKSAGGADNVRVESTMAYDGKPLGILLEDLARDYEEIKAENVILKEQLEYKEDMVRHLNELLSSKDEEIPRLNHRVHELECAQEEAKERTSKLESMHEATLQHLSAAREEVHQLKQTNHTQQRQLKESGRKLKTQENRLGSIKSLVTSLNFNMETWMDEEEWREGSASGESMGGKISTNEDNDDDDDENHTYTSTIEDVDTSGQDPSSSSSSSRPGMEEHEEEEGQNPTVEVTTEDSTNENSTSCDTVTGTTVVVPLVGRESDDGSRHEEKKDESSVLDICKAGTYETATTNTTTPTYIDSPSVCDKSATGVTESRSVNSAPLFMDGTEAEDCGQETISLPAASTFSTFHGRFTNCDLPRSI